MSFFNKDVKTFSQQAKKSSRYEILKTLGANPRAGRATYKALDKKTEQLVVIKQFQFFKAENWTGYKSVEREIQILKNLCHPNLPKYLDFFETDDGICLVQEYIEAPHLTPELGYSESEIESIVRQVLAILTYLQQQNPPIIHRDIKPENILFNRQANKAYLVDFGLAKGSNEETGNSTILAGTFGFMAPELLHNKSFPASDLYAFGVTLISLLWRIESQNISNFINWESFSVNWQRLNVKEKISSDWINWLKKLTDPSLKSRVNSAKEALTLFEKRTQKRIQKPTKKAIGSRRIAIGLSVAAVVGVGVVGRQVLFHPVNHVEKTDRITAPTPVAKPKKLPTIEPEESITSIFISDSFPEFRPLLNIVKSVIVVLLVIVIGGCLFCCAYEVAYMKQPISVVLEPAFGVFIIIALSIPVLIIL